MKKTNIFFVFGFSMIIWACCFFAISSKTGNMDVLSAAEARFYVLQRARAEVINNTSVSYLQEMDVIDEKFDQENIVPQPTFVVLNIEQGQDLILNSYRNPKLQQYVVEFFREITNSQEVAEVILHYACLNNIPPALAFSLCAEESNFRPRAFNTNRNGSVDRGLFQLNNESFPHLTLDEFYDIAVNTRIGLAYLRERLDFAGTEIAALAMYNAGIGRVSSAGTPQSTLNYISRILRRQRSIEERFIAKYIDINQEGSAKYGDCCSQNEPLTFRLNLLVPLGR